MHCLKDEYEATVTELLSKGDPSKYDETLKKLCTLRTVGELSYLLHHIRSFEDPLSYNLNIFKKGVSASWEDPANISGCSWIVQFKSEISNLLFERLCIYFCLVGFKEFNCNGIKINVRRGYVKFTVWSGNVPSVVDGSSVMEELQRSFGLDYEIDFTYKNHKELLNKVVARG